MPQDGGSYLSDITVNLRPDTKRDLRAYSLIRGVAMSTIAYEALAEYLETPAARVDAPKRERAASERWGLALTPDLRQRLDRRAAIEIGPPTGKLGAGRKTYKAGVIRRALEAYFTNLPDDERARIDAQRGILYA